MEPISVVPSFRRSATRRRTVPRGPLLNLTVAGSWHGCVSARRFPGAGVAAVTALFKDAVLSKHQKIHGDPSAVLHGHGFGVSGYEIARFLALPDVGFHRSRGRIHGLALWMPPGSDAVERQRARDRSTSGRPA